MNAEQAIRYLGHEASYWRALGNATPEELEALCLLVPALLELLELAPMSGIEAARFRRELKESFSNETTRV